MTYSWCRRHRTELPSWTGRAVHRYAVYNRYPGRRQTRRVDPRYCRHQLTSAGRRPTSATSNWPAASTNITYYAKNPQLCWNSLGFTGTTFHSVLHITVSKQDITLVVDCCDALASWNPYTDPTSYCNQPSWACIFATAYHCLLFFLTILWKHPFSKYLHQCLHLS